MFQLATKFTLALALAQMSTSVLAGAIVSPNETDAMRLQAFECRCGVSQFLSMPHANITDPLETGGCHSYVLVDARGTQEPQGVSTMFYPMIHTILDQLLGGVSLPVQYPAGVAQDTASGEEFVIDTINRGLHDCPEQKYALFGYSQGATLMLRAVGRLSGKAADAIKSVVLVGNPYRLPGKLSNVNGTGQPGNDNNTGLFVDAAVANNETIPQLSNELDRSGKVLDYCLEGDGVCAPNPACSCQLPAGHLSYASVASVQDTAVKHVVTRLSGPPVF